MTELEAFIDRIQSFNIKNDPNISLLSALEELGEFSTALSVEQKNKVKNLTEGTKEEAVDLIICVLDLFYTVGGTKEFLVNYGNAKLDKWENNERSRT